MGSEQWTRDGDWFQLTETHRAVRSMDWRVQADWKDRFRFRNEPEMDMSSRVGSGLIHIEVEKVRVVEWIGFHLHRVMQSPPVGAGPPRPYPAGLRIEASKGAATAIP